MKLKIAVLVASVRDERNGDLIVEWLKTEVAQYTGNLSFTFIDLKEEEVPRYSAAKVPAQRAYKDEFTITWSKRIEAYDGFVVVTPEYNHSYPTAIKDALDHLFHELTYKPISFIGYGTEGGVRAIEHLRQVAIQLAMVPTRREVTIPIWEMLKGGVPLIASHYHGATQELFRQLEWWTEALVKARAEKPPVL